jgi:hypothetical protein
MSELARAVPLTEVKGNKSYLFYGPGGAGKTYLAFKHPGKRKLIIDIDQRAHELFPLLTPDERSTITVWSPNETLNETGVFVAEVDPKRADMSKGTQFKVEPKGYYKIAAVVNELLAMRKQESFPYDLVIMDSLTRIIDHLIYLVMYTHKVTNMTQTLFQVEGRNAKDLVLGFLELPCDRILIAHSHHKEVRDKDTGALVKETIRPHVFGSDSLREELSTLFSEVYYFHGFNPNTKKYLIQTANDRIRPARTAKGLAFEQEVEPTKIFA